MTAINTDRFQVVDFIRGFALLGILIINIQTFSLFFVLTDPQQVYDMKLDKPETYVPVNFTINLLVSGQFYTIYSFLFGLGFYLLLEKYNRLGLNGNKLFKRRLWVLLCFGLIHGLFIWFGDVLHKYALLGFTLLYFNKKTVPVLLKWIAGFMIGVITILVVKYLFFVSEQGMAKDKQDMAVLVEGIIKIWQHGTFLEVMGFQKLGVLVGHVLNLTNGLFWYVHYEVMFLIGLIAGKTNFFYKLSRYKPILKRALFYILPAALLLKGISCLPLEGIPLSKSPVYEEMAIMLMQFIGIPLLTICYLIILVLIFPEKSSRFFTWIANTGRLGLTNYLGQTLICMIIFYGYSFGLAGKLSLWQTLVAALLIYTAQIIYSNIWLRYFSIGPMENLWRKLIMYRKASPSEVASL